MNIEAMVSYWRELAEKSEQAAIKYRNAFLEASEEASFAKQKIEDCDRCISKLESEISRLHTEHQKERHRLNEEIYRLEKAGAK